MWHVARGRGGGEKERVGDGTYETPTGCREIQAGITMFKLNLKEEIESHREVASLLSHSWQERS